MSKLIKPSSDPLELEISQYILDLETNTDLKHDLRGLQFASAKLIDVGHSRKAIVIFVPVPLLPLWHKIHLKLIRELEKKLSDKHVLVVAQRRIMSKPKRNSRVKQPRPRSRCLTAVHDALLHDLVYPTEIVGKRTRQRIDGSRLLKVFLDRKDHTSLEYKLDTFASAYKRLTGKEVVFEFPAQSMVQE